MAREQAPPKIQLVFFRTSTGSEPVGDWLKGLDEADRHAIGKNLLRAQKELERMSRKHVGSSIDDFLRKEDIFEEAQAQAIKEVVAWQLAKAMKKKRLSKARMAVLLRTSRSQVDRILDPKHDITLSTLQRAAALVGHRVMIELI